MRRFELIKGNQGKFWEIEHWDDTVITRQGKLGSSPKDKLKTLDDDMAAEVEFDKMIHQKRRQGFVEVDKPTDAITPIEARALSLRPLDGTEAHELSGEAAKYMIWRMVEIQLFDRHRVADDLSRWGRRAARQLGLDDVPAEGDASFEDWQTRTRELSSRDRSAKMKDDMIGAFKFRSGSHWIISPKEANRIATESGGRRPKRKKETDEQTAWLNAWCAFHQRVMSVGYEIVPV